MPRLNFRPNSLQEIPERQGRETADDTADVGWKWKAKNRLPHEGDEITRGQHRGDSDQQSLPEREVKGHGRYFSDVSSIRNVH